MTANYDLEKKNPYYMGKYVKRVSKGLEDKRDSFPILFLFQVMDLN